MILSSNNVDYRKKAKRLNKKFSFGKIVEYDTEELNLFDEETDSVIEEITKLVSLEAPDIKTLNNNELASSLDKPEQYRDPFEIVHELIKDDTIATILLNNGYFTVDLISAMSDTDMTDAGLSEMQMKRLQEIIAKWNRNSPVSQVSPSLSRRGSHLSLSQESTELPTIKIAHSKTPSLAMLGCANTPSSQTSNQSFATTPSSIRVDGQTNANSLGCISREQSLTQPLEFGITPRRQRRNADRRRGGTWTILDEDALKTASFE